MPKVQSQSGVSLGDTYDVEGSIIGVEELVTRDVSLIHEMGGQIHSERLICSIIQLSAVDIDQSLNFNVQSAAMPDCVHRILGCYVQVDVTARVQHCTVTMLAAGAGGEFPIWNWDTNIDAEGAIRISVAGGSAGNDQILRPAGPQQPFQQLLMRMGPENIMPTFFLRGATPAFGAGDVTVDAFILIARPAPTVQTMGVPKSHGLPIPGW